MRNVFSKYIIIGAGLSGLSAAHTLHKTGEFRFVILESRDRAGGRILTKNGIDFGATWFQNHHEVVLAMLDELEVEKFHQYSLGQSILVYSSMAPAHYFVRDPNAPSAYRIKGGSSALVSALQKPISDKIFTNTTVSEIRKSKKGVKVITSKGEYEAEKVIITIPPRLATGITFEPALPETMIEAMRTTHTWMSNAIKVGMQFEHPFWRKKGLSGMMIGQGGAVTELYDHTCKDGKNHTLMGFINEGLRELSPKKRKERILDYISKFLGEEVYSYTTYEEKDWYRDHDTSCEKLHSVYISPQYGKPEFQKSYMQGTLFFSGAETSTVYGGYMDGAIRSGILSAKRLLKHVE